MKKVMLFVALFAFNQISFAQCDKKVTFKCNKGRDFKDGSVGQEMPFDATINIEDGKIILVATLNGESETVESEIKEVAICEWSGYLKNGKTQYKALTKRGGENADLSIITIEGENGMIKITFGSDPDTGGKLQFDVEEYTITADVNTNNLPGKTDKKKKRQKKTSTAGLKG